MPKDINSLQPIRSTLQKQRKEKYLLFLFYFQSPHAPYCYEDQIQTHQAAILNVCSPSETEYEHTAATS